MKKTLWTILTTWLVLAVFAGCDRNDPRGDASNEPERATEASPDQRAADAVAALIDAIYVQERTGETDAQCSAAKAAWDALTDAQKALVSGEHADPDYFGLDTGDASLDEPLSADGIGENEILVVSFGTSFNESRVEDIGAVEKAIAAAYPEWSVRRAFTAQIIVNHVQARDGEKIDNIEQALERAVGSGVKNLVVAPTLLMHGAEYDEAVAVVERYAEKFETVKIAEPLLGRAFPDANVSSADQESVVQALVADAVAVSGFDSLASAAGQGTAYVFLGHGTSHSASVAYSQTQAAVAKLGYNNVWIGTVEGKPETTACERVIDAVAAAGFRNVVLRPFMVVAGDHAHNDMAGDDDDSWKSLFKASGKFDSVETQIFGLGRLPAIRDLYLARLADAMETAE